MSDSVSWISNTPVQANSLQPVTQTQSYTTITVESLKNQAANLQSNANSTTSNTSDQISAIVQQFANGMSSSNILNVSPDIAVSAYKNSNLNFVDNNIVNNTNVGNFSTGLNNSISSFTNSIKSVTSSLTSSTNNLKKDGVAFIASTTSKMIDGIDLPGVSDLGSFLNFGTAQIGKLASLGGDALKSVNDGLKAVTGSIGELYNAGKTAITTVTSSVGQVGNAIVSPVKDVLPTVYAVTDPRFANALVQSNLSFLPAEFQQVFGYKAAQLVANATGNFNQNVTNILNKTIALETLFGTGSMTSLYTNLQNYGNGLGGYGNGTTTISSITGGYLYGQSSFTGTSTQYNELINAVNTLCGRNVVANITTDYSTNKDLFDMLLSAFLNTGAGKLLESLLNCGINSSGVDYVTGRSANIIRENLNKVTTSGDVYSYKTIISTVGTEVVTNPTTDMLYLYTNAPNDTQAQADLVEIGSTLGVEDNQILSFKMSNGTEVLDSSKVTLIQNADEVYSSKFLSNTEYAAVNAALCMYGTQ